MKGFFIEDWPNAPDPKTAERIIELVAENEEQKLIMEAQRDGLTKAKIMIETMRAMLNMRRKAERGAPIFVSLN